MYYEDGGEGSFGQAQRHVRYFVPGMCNVGNFFGFAHQADESVDKNGNKDRCHDESYPRPRWFQSEPGQGQEGGHGQRHRTASDIIEDFPSGEQAQRIFHPFFIWSRDFWQQPEEDLPVSADPSVSSFHIRAVAHGEVFEQLDAGGQSCSRVAAFQQVVAENCVFRETVSEDFAEGFDIVDSFSDERACLEEILVDIETVFV